MAYPTRIKGNIGVHDKRRLVKKSKWELPNHDAKSYWEKICNDIESRGSRTVRYPFSSAPVTFPVISLPSIRYPTTSSVSPEDTSSDNLSIRKETPSYQSFARVPSSSSSANSFIAMKLSPAKASDLDTTKIFCRPTKLKKLTKLVNDFLLTTRARVRPPTGKSKKNEGPVKKRRENNRHDKSMLKSEKSSGPRLKNISSEHTAPEEGIRSECLEENLRIFRETIGKKISVGFRENSGEMIDKNIDEKGEPVDMPERKRAPSLSIASALPSFGKVVISIEDMDSTENEEERSKLLDTSNRVTSKDYRKTIGFNSLKIYEEKPTQDFLKVPQIRSSASASYPLGDESKYENRNESDEIRLADEAYALKLLEDSRMFKMKYPFWPKRSIANIFHALRTMKNGLRSRARIESDTNRFFSAPLEIYSPSPRSSMSSNDQTDSEDANVPMSMSKRNDAQRMDRSDDDGNESRVRIDKESKSSSYPSVRERLMRKSVGHLFEESRRGAAATCIDEDNVLEKTSEQTNPSSFYNSWATTSKNGMVKKRRNKKTSDRRLIGIPRVRSIFPRVKADKCLACMHESLGGIDQSSGRKAAGIFPDGEIANDVILRHDESLSEIFGADFSTETSFDQFHRDLHRALLSRDKSMMKSLAEGYQRRSIIADSASEQLVETDYSSGKASVPEVVRQSALDDSAGSRTIVKPLSRIAVSAVSQITSMSQRSRSISDQDDSDQGCIDPAGTEAALGGGSASKYLAPCHMPVNLKPSLEPLKALRSKKSRSIKSRVASAEKSGDSDNDDEDDSDYEENLGRQSMSKVQKTLDPDEISAKLVGTSSPRDERIRKIRTKACEDVPSGDPTDTEEKECIVKCEGPISTTAKVDATPREIPPNDVPIISDREVIEISTECLHRSMTVNEILRVLAAEYSKRLSDRCSEGNRSPRSINARKNEKIATNLLTLLVDSRRYLSRGKRRNNTPDLPFSSKQPTLCNSRQLRRVLPLKSYNLIAPILEMPKWCPNEKMRSLRDVAKRASRKTPRERSTLSAFDLLVSSNEPQTLKLLREKFFKSQVHPPSRTQQNVTFEKGWTDTRPKVNPYFLFLLKPRRKAVTWRPLTERDLEGYDPEATLKKRAAKITDRICEDFCQWLESLAAGTNQKNDIDVGVLKDMFETDFTAEVCRTMQVLIKEMPMVPTAVAVARNCPGASELALTRRHLVKDARAEKRAKKTVGFGSSLPANLKSVPPCNRVDEKWLQCENVPIDLETMEAVWKDITHLSSVKGFIKWLRAHPEVKRPKGFEKSLPWKEASAPRKSVANDLKHLELDLDQIQSLKVADDAPEVY